MERSQLCSSCGLTSQRCECPTTTQKAVEITPAYLGSCYFYTLSILFIIALVIVGFIFFIVKVNTKESCYLELFADSVSVVNANANISAVDLTIRFITKSPVTGCRIPLKTIRSRLLRGNEVISSSSPDPFGESFREYHTVTTVDFKTVPDVIGAGVVVWDFRVEIVAGVETDSEPKCGYGFLMVVCSDLPVEFTADPAGNVIGSLLGNMRRCDYSFRSNLH